MSRVGAHLWSTQPEIVEFGNFEIILANTVHNYMLTTEGTCSQSACTIDIYTCYQSLVPPYYVLGCLNPELDDLV